MTFGKRVFALCFENLQPAFQLLDFLFTLVPGLFENSITIGKYLALQPGLQTRPAHLMHTLFLLWVFGEAAQNYTEISSYLVQTDLKGHMGHNHRDGLVWKYLPSSF